MSITELLKNAEFWAALFGALAAFLLGAMGQWWAEMRRRQTAGNLALITLSQMYSQVENLRHHFLDQEATRAANALKRQPFTLEIRAAIGLSEQTLQLQLNDLGFLADSHDPDILNRLLTVERAFTSMVGLVKTHSELQAQLQERMSSIDPEGTRGYHIHQLPALVGGPLVFQVDDAVIGLIDGLPETRDFLINIARQLRDILRIQLPIARFLDFGPAPRSRIVDQPPELPPPPLGHRFVRWAFDFLFKRRRWWRRSGPAAADVPDEAKPPEIKPFPRRPEISVQRR